MEKIRIWGSRVLDFVEKIRILGSRVLDFMKNRKFAPKPNLMEDRRGKGRICDEIGKN